MTDTNSFSSKLKSNWDFVSILISGVTTLVNLGVLVFRKEPVFSIISIGILLTILAAWYCRYVSTSTDYKIVDHQTGPAGGMPPWPGGKKVSKYSSGQKKYARIGFRLSWVLTLVWLAISVPFGINYLNEKALFVKPAATGETLLLIANFDNSYANKGFNATERIYGLISEKLPKSGGVLRVEKYPEILKDKKAAREVLEKYRATLLIWGWYDDGGAQANVELAQERVLTVKEDFIVATPESFHFKNVASQASYLTFFSLGMMQLGSNSAVALEFFTAAIESSQDVGEDANPWEALMWRGNIYAWGGEYDLAIKDYNEAISLHPHREGYYNRGNSLGGQQKFDLAIADYSKAIEIDPQYIDAYYNRGAAYVALQKFDLAIADYSKAIEIDPKYIGAYINRSLTYDALQKFDLAIADHSKAIEIDPNVKENYLGRGNEYGAQQKYDLAIADYSKAIEIDPQYKEVYLNRGAANAALQKYDLAIADFSKAIEIDPAFADGYTGRGNVYADSGKYLDAIADYQKSISIEPSAYTFCVLGITYKKTGDFSEAEKAFTQGIKLDSANQYAWCQTALDELPASETPGP
jgi:tetratricopeptide (TPR) repeat protein